MSTPRRFFKYVDGRKYGIEVTETGPGPLVHITTDALVQILRLGGFTEKENTMSNLTHCDGPDCDVTKAKGDEQRMCAAPWIRVEPDGPSSALDFHRDACVVAYFSQGVTPDDRLDLDALCTCMHSQPDPHTQGEHREHGPRPTVVDGR